MRRILVLEHISLDGVIQGPGGRDEDPSDGFEGGGWIGGYSDSTLEEGLGELMDSEFDLLLGRKTYDIWAPYWPNHSDVWPRASAATKYVASNTLASGSWHRTEILNGDVVEKVKKLKQGKGKDLHVWGSGGLLQTLFKYDLVDALFLMIYPITLGAGKRLFSFGTIRKSFSLTANRSTTKGVVMANYGREIENPSLDRA